MPVVLARIDDRFIHGQVTVGWSEHLHPDRILLADNPIAADSWQSRIYASTVPPHIEVSIETIARSAAVLADEAHREEKILLLTGHPEAMAELVRLGAPVSEVNVGGLHFSGGRQELLPFVYVDQHDLKALDRLLEMGVRLTAQQVPGGRAHPLESGDLDAMKERF
jgi:mannose/fructose/N-acetylgalactosamine-specific phosphotransferase system component IIB